MNLFQEKNKAFKYDQADFYSTVIAQLDCLHALLVRLVKLHLFMAQYRAIAARRDNSPLLRMQHYVQSVLPVTINLQQDNLRAANVKLVRIGSCNFNPNL